ncbi:beta-ketoacyl synthase chain length factor [Aquincola sp. S2]|uniref:Beta-ketoacyl synthase chain length factor n=1 Tax=Pseudaquabacterium terrae TaxID=2732868 RepID=A0ABX2EJE5_9BURK|nr:beta-ketoacyl synthase chain length factor [Aquabacterium terrae]NRF68692.1 beta-ketoacyl synthase chain length factor [Aquabacterium terrae]
MAFEVSVRGVGLVGPGLADWTQGQVLLGEPAGWASAPTVLTAPARLAPTERRRAGAIVKLSFAVADQACAQAGVDVHTLATVFSSTGSDSANCHALCEALAQPERIVSPTRFTNSVHNAAAGYWHIATQSRAPSTSLCAFDGSFAAGLLEAAAQAVSLRRPVLLVAADVPYPEPLNGTRPLPDAFGLALLLDADPALGGVRLGLSLAAATAAATPCTHPGFEALRAAIPAARGLPLLEQLAAPAPAATLRIDYLEDLHLVLQVQTR